MCEGMLTVQPCFGFHASRFAIRLHRRFLGIQLLDFQISNKNRLGLLIKGFPIVSAQWEGQDLNHLLGHNKQPQLKVNKCFCVICISKIVKNMFCFVFQLFSFYGGYIVLLYAQNLFTQPLSDIYLNIIICSEKQQCYFPVRKVPGPLRLAIILQ